MKLEINPIRDNKIEYIWFSHKKPWKTNIGSINTSRLEDGLIKVNFTVSIHQARKDPRWDPVNKKVIIEVLDADGRVVVDNWLSFKDKRAVTATLCLGDPNGI